MPQDTEAYAVRNFSTLLGTLEDGQLNSDLSMDLEDEAEEPAATRP